MCRLKYSRLTVAIVLNILTFTPCAVGESPEIISPGVGEVLQAGSSYTIRWEYGMAEYGYLTLFRGGEAYLTLSLLPAGTSEFEWNVCSTIGNGSDYRILLSGTLEGGVYHQAWSPPFTVTGSGPVPNLTITSQFSGTSFAAGSSHWITWDTSGVSGHVDVWVSRRTAPVDYGWIGSAAVADGRIAWEVCSSLVPADDYYIQITYSFCGQRFEASMDGAFSISSNSEATSLSITIPTAGDTWQAGESQTVHWTSVNPTGEVLIGLYRNGKHAFSLGKADMGTGVWSGELCDATDPGDYELVVSWTVCDYRYHVASVEPVHIAGGKRPTLNITSPMGGQVLRAGEGQVISWMGMDLPEEPYLLSFELLWGDEPWGQGIMYTTLSSHSILWSICPFTTPRTDYRLKISVPTCAERVVAITEPFSIVGALPVPTIHLVSPDGGERLQAGSTIDIQWTSTNPVGIVDISLRADDGEVSDLGSAQMSSGHALRVLCPTLPRGTGYKVELWASNCHTIVTDTSDGPFTIVENDPAPNLVITNPITDQEWEAGITQTITWTSTDTSVGASYAFLKRGNDVVPLQCWPARAASMDVAVCDPRRHTGPGFALHLAWFHCGRTQTTVAPGLISIAPSVTPAPQLQLTSPHAGEVLQAGSPHTVAWTGLGLPDYLSFRLLKGGEHDRDLFTEQPLMISSGSGQATWDVCSIGIDGDDFQVEAMACDCRGCTAFLSETFSIVGQAPPPTLQLVEGLAGQVIEPGSQHRITWTSTNPVGEVRIDLQRLGASFATLGSSPMASGEFLWQVCPTLPPYDQYTIALFHNNCVASLRSYVQGDPTFLISDHGEISPRVDLNYDCIVDGADVEVFRYCMTGPAIPANVYPHTVICPVPLDGEGLSPVDYDRDSDVDMDDFGVLQRSLSQP